MSAALEMPVEVGQYVPETDEGEFKQIKDASAWRWLFNPAAKIDVSRRAVGYDVNEKGERVTRSFIPAGTLTPITNTTIYVPPRDAKAPAPMFARPATPVRQRLVPQTKYAFEIADELTSQVAYADTGLVAIEPLTGVEDEREVRGILRMLFGENIRVGTDPSLPGERVPALPAMLAYLDTQAKANIERAFAERNEPGLRKRIEDTRDALRGSIVAGIGWARGIVDNSRTQLKTRTPLGGTAKIEFDPRDRRAFLALGETVPSEQGVAVTQPQAATPADFAPVLDVMMKQAEQMAEMRAEIAELRKGRGGRPKKDGEPE
jgi:hypothetical protein